MICNSTFCLVEALPAALFLEVSVDARRVSQSQDSQRHHIKSIICIVRNSSSSHFLTCNDAYLG